MKIKLGLFIIIIVFSSCSITKNKTITDKRTERKELIGTCTRAGFQKEEFKTWFQKGYNEYKPDAEVVNKLKEQVLYKGVSIKIIFGTWCGDSRRELPRFYKIADETNIPGNIVSLTAIDTKRSSRDKKLDSVEFTRIPTFIFYKNGEEIGRIVESAKESLEKDMLSILEKK